MIYVCADDYGLSSNLSMRIKECLDNGGLTKVSVFPNFEATNLSELKNAHISLHLNLVEGRCMSDRKDVDLITDNEGDFKYAFGGLLLKSIFHKKKFESQIYAEIKEQLSFWKRLFPDGTPLLIDSHQHTHMIPSVFKMLLRVISEEKVEVKYLRIPAEPLSPFIKCPSLYFTYKPINLIKQWLLKLLWLFDKPLFKKSNIPTAYFFGVLLSGEMDKKRVDKILPKYIELSKRKNRDLEVLLHPGYLESKEISSVKNKIKFKDFYLSQNRKTEFDTAIKIHLKEV